MDRDLYDSIVAQLPGYQGDSDIYSWLPAQQAYTQEYVADPPGSPTGFRLFNLADPPSALPVATFTANMFTNVFF